MPKVPYFPFRSYLGDIKQAGRREIAIDQNGHSLYYGIHVNQAFADFIHANHLETAQALQNYPKDPILSKLFFPAGVVEYKSAWQLVDPMNPPSDLSDYIVIDATVPTLRAGKDAQGNNEIVEDRNAPLLSKLRLLALHVVFTLPGHPEFVWATFEHLGNLGEGDAAANSGATNVAPMMSDNPSSTDPDNRSNSAVVSAATDYILYGAGVKASDADVSIPESQLLLNEATQTFVDAQGKPRKTPVYRMFPASKSNTTDPDDAITSLNQNVAALFAQAASSGPLRVVDKRGHYRLVGAQWMDKPQYFGPDRALQNDKTSPFAQEHGSAQDVAHVGIGLQQFTTAIEADGSDSPYSILAGEDRLSSTSMESFTQPSSLFDNCFTCHNTQAITANGIPLDHDRGGIKLLDPGLLNVSHVLSQFLLEQCTAPANLVLNPDGSQSAVCP